MFLAVNSSLPLPSSKENNISNNISPKKEDDDSSINVKELEETLARVRELILNSENFETIKDIIFLTIRTSPLFQSNQPPQTMKKSATSTTKNNLPQKTLTNSQILLEKKLNSLQHSFFSLGLDLLIHHNLLFTIKEKEKIVIQALNQFPTDPLIWEMVSMIPPSSFNCLLASRFSIDQANNLWPSNKRIKRRLDLVDSSLGLGIPIEGSYELLLSSSLQEVDHNHYNQIWGEANNTKEDFTFKISDRTQSLRELLLGIQDIICSFNLFFASSSTTTATTSTIETLPSTQPFKTRRSGQSEMKGWSSTFRISFKRDDPPHPPPPQPSSLSLSKPPSLNCLSQPRRQTSRNVKKSNSPPSPPPSSSQLPPPPSQLLPPTTMIQTDTQMVSTSFLDISISLHNIFSTSEIPIREEELNESVDEEEFDSSLIKFNDSGLLMDLFIEIFSIINEKGINNFPTLIIKSLSTILKEASRDFLLFKGESFPLRKAILEASLNSPLDASLSRSILYALFDDEEKRSSPILLSIFNITKEPYVLSLSMMSYNVPFYSFIENKLIKEDHFLFQREYYQLRMDFINKKIDDSQFEKILDSIVLNENDPIFFSIILSYSPKNDYLFYGALKYAVKMDSRKQIHEAIDALSFDILRKQYLLKDFFLLKRIIYSSKHCIDLKMFLKIITKLIPPLRKESDAFIQSFFSTITYQELKGDLDCYNQILHSSIMALSNGKLKFSLLRLTIPIPMTIFSIQDDLKDSLSFKELIPSSLTHSSTLGTFWTLLNDQERYSLFADFVNLLFEYYNFYSNEKGISVLDYLLRWSDLNIFYTEKQHDQSLSSLAVILSQRPSLVEKTPLLLPTSLFENNIKKKLIKMRIDLYNHNRSRVPQNIKIILEDCKYLVCIERKKEEKKIYLNFISLFINDFLRFTFLNCSSPELESLTASSSSSLTTSTTSTTSSSSSTSVTSTSSGGGDIRNQIELYLIILFNCSKIVNLSFDFAKVLNDLTASNSAFSVFFKYFTRKEAVLKGLTLLEMNDHIDNVNGKKERILRCLMYKDIVPIKPVLREMLMVLKEYEFGHKDEGEFGDKGQSEGEDLTWKSLFVDEIIANRLSVPSVYEEFIKLSNALNDDKFITKYEGNWTPLHKAMEMSDGDEDNFLSFWSKIIPIAAKGRTSNVFLNIQSSPFSYYPGEHFMLAELCLRESCKAFTNRALEGENQAFKEKASDYLLCLLGRLLNNSNAKMTILSRKTLLQEIWKLFSSLNVNDPNDINDRVKKIKRQLRAEGIDE